MPRAHSPKKGTMQFWPRKRARRIFPRIKNWPKLSKSKLLGFIGYKAGMTHIQYYDNKPTSLTKNQIVTIPVTILECPSIKAHSLRFYKKTDYGSKIISEIKNTNEKIPEDFDDIKIVINTQPSLTGIGKKVPEVLEMGLSGNKDEKLSLAKELLGKEIKISDVFKEGQFIDIHAVTQGKGFQGAVKRFGVKIRQHKSEKTKRGTGSLGAWTPKKVLFSVPMPGKMGYHTRTEFNKWLLKIGNDPKNIAIKGGLLHYGLIKNNYILVKGSVPGPVKRPIILTEPIRQLKKIPPLPEITYISLESKQ